MTSGWQRASAEFGDEVTERQRQVYPNKPTRIEHLCQGVEWLHYGSEGCEGSMVSELFVEATLIADIILEDGVYYVWAEGDLNTPAECSSFDEAKACAEESLPDLVRLALLQVRAT